MSQVATRHRPPPIPRPATPAPANRGSYLSHAERSLARAAAAPDATARALHQEECQLWLMLARQRRAIDDVLQRFVVEETAA
jgi:hypothetical protein